MDDPALLDAVRLRALYAEGALSPVAVTDAVLARIDALEPQLRALYAPDPDAARRAAAEAGSRWRAGQPAGPIDGVPITLKENIATVGTPVPVGSAITPLVPATEDAPAAARVRESGGVLLAKTSMPDLGMLTTGLSSVHALTRNPWDTRRTPGGSSSGGAAAAAAGYGPLHVGTDIGGSVRLPAAWCGLVGVKPSFGRVPVDPPFLGRHVGPLTRTVADAALLLSVLARPDPRDHLALPPAELDWTGAVAADLDVRGLRVGLLLDAGVGLPVDPEIAAVVEAAAAGLAGRGARVERVAPFLTRAMIDGLDRFWRARAWSALVDLTPAERDAALPIITAWAGVAAGYSGVEVYRGFTQQDAISRATLAATEPYDLVLCPVCPVGPPAAESASPTDDPERPFEHITFTVPFNMSGQPAVSVNGGYHRDGLPIGVQLVGRRFDDLGVLRAAADLERHRPPQHPWPLD